MVTRIQIGLKSRDHIGSWIAGFGLLDVAVEVGVHQGDFAVPFLNAWPGRLFIAVDPWAVLDDYDDALNNYIDKTRPRVTRSTDDREPDYKIAMARFRAFETRVQVIRKTLAEAVAELPPEIDFGYIDANHALTHVREDIGLLWPLIRPGGCLAGHDYDCRAWPGVGRAVDEFADSLGHPVYLAPPSGWQSWAVWKTSGGVMPTPPRAISAISSR